MAADGGEGPARRLPSFGSLADWPIDRFPILSIDRRRALSRLSVGCRLGLLPTMRRSTALFACVVQSRPSSFLLRSRALPLLTSTRAHNTPIHTQKQQHHTTLGGAAKSWVRQNSLKLIQGAWNDVWAGVARLLVGVPVRRSVWGRGQAQGPAAQTEWPADAQAQSLAAAVDRSIDLSGAAGGVGVCGGQRWLGPLESAGALRWRSASPTP